MADNKKLQYGTISGPPKKPNEPETEIITANPPGRKPPNVIGNTRFEVAPEAEPSATNPPGGIKTPTEVETGSASKQPPTNVIRGVRYEVAPQPKPQPAHLAQEIKPPVKTKTEEPTTQYSPEGTRRIKGWERTADDLPIGPEKSYALNQAQQAKQQDQKNQEEKYGPVPEKDLPTIAKMYGEFKKIYYQGIADANYKNNKQAYKKFDSEREIGASAHFAQESQIYAMRYGMSSLVNLHQGLDIASWNFFFKTLGPLGIALFGPLGALGMPLSSVLEKIHSKEISFNMDYYGGRAWWSPYRIDYLIKTLPEEKAVDLILDVSLKTLYLVNKVSGLGLVSRTYDKYGRPKRGYVFTPLLKLQRGVFGVGEFLDKITTEKSVRDLTEELTRAVSVDPGNKKLHDFIQNKLMTERQKNNWRFIPGKNELFPRIFRFLGLKSVSKNLRKTDKDVLSYFAILVGGWIFDVTIGNIARIVGEKIASTVVWQKLSLALDQLAEHPLIKATSMGWRTIGDFAGAAPSLNTFAGGYLGYQFAGPIGVPVGAGLGWGYQWVLNMSKDLEMVKWTNDFSRLWKNFYDTRSLLNRFPEGSPESQFLKGQLREAELQLGKSYFRLSEVEIAKLPRWQQIGIRVANGLSPTLNPGILQRFSAWLQTPVGQFFRLPIKGLAVSQMLAPFEAQIQQVFPFYQGWMPPVVEWLWETKGAWWKTVFQPSVGRLWNNLRFGSMEIEGSMRVPNLMQNPISGSPKFWESRVSGQLIFEGENGFYSVTPRGWFQQYLNIKGDLNEIFGQQGSIAQRVGKFFEGHPTLNRFVGGLREVGVTNFAGFLIGFELASTLTGGNLIAALAGGVGGWFLANPILTATETLLEKFGLFNAGPAAFVGLFNTGFWLGAGAQFVAGFFGLNLPFWFPLASGLTFAFAPTILAYAGALVAAISPTVGAFLFNLGGALAFGGVGGMVAFTTVLAVTSVAALAVFSIIIIGSAFWVPISENLKGLTATSPCFDISSPTFTDINGNNSNAIFTNGEEKTVCWTTTNKQEFYKDGITETKSWYPNSNFTVNNYQVTINTLDGKSLVWNKNSPGLQGGFNLSASPFLSSDQYLQGGGFRFNITPPKDTGGLYKSQMAQQINGIVTQIKNGDTADELMDQITFAQIYNEVQRDYVLKPALAALQSMSGDPTKTKPLQDAINNLSYSPDDMQNRLTWCPTGACQFSRTCTFPGTDPALLAKCKTYQDGVSKNYTPDLKTQLENIFNPIINGASPAQIQAQIGILQDQIGAITDNGRNGARAQISLINEIKNSGMTNKTGAELQTAVDNLATTFATNNPQNYFPAGSTIKTCLTLKYNGESGKVANIAEKDDAILPVIGPLTVPSCQAQIITPINAAGPGNLLWPTDKRSISGNGYTASHTGIDIAGTPGTPAMAAASGTILKQGNDPASKDSNGVLLSLGNYVIVQGDDGYYYIYGHLGTNGNDNGVFTKKIGDRVNAKDSVGYIGNSGITSGENGGVHLHFGVSTTASGVGASDFYNNSTTTLNPCGFLQGGCP